MYVLITYDVATKTAAGSRRLRKIAKKCVAHGQRVQNSVFECSLEPAQLTKLKSELISIMDDSEDSLRIYNLGKGWRNRVEHFGAKKPYDPDASMII